VVVCRFCSVVFAIVFSTVTAGAQTPAAQTPAPAPAVPSAGTDTIQRVADLIAKAPGPYKQLAPGVWETTYKGKHLPVIRVRIAAAEDGVFFIVPLFTRDKLALSQAFLLRIAEFNAEYDFVKLALDKSSLNLRLDSYAPLVDAATLSSLEGHTALAADEAYALIRNMLPAPTP
jgi:hypothetical protein